MDYEKLVYYDNESWRSYLVKDCSFICKEDAIAATIEANLYESSDYFEKLKQIPDWCSTKSTVYVLSEERFCYVEYVIPGNPTIVFCCSFAPLEYCTWYKISDLRPAENTMFSDIWRYQCEDGTWVEVDIDENKRVINPDLKN